MDTAGIYARESPVLDRVVQLGLAGGKVISTSFPASVPPDAEQEHALLDRVFDYLDGNPDDFRDVDVALTVPTDQRRVLDAVRKVPYGETVTAAKIARMAGLDDEDESDRATVDAALRENPVPLVVPDHRVDGPGATPPSVGETLRSIESDAGN